jgi:hypothetical protein
VTLFNFGLKKTIRSGNQYHPFNIGLPLPAGEFCYEFLIGGKLRKNAYGFQNEILKVFIENNASVIWSSSQINYERGSLALTSCCDLESSSLGPVELSSVIRKEKFVDNVEYQEMRGRMFGQSFPLTFSDTQRAVALHSNTLIKIGNRLATDTGTVGTKALFEEGRNYITEVIRDFTELLNDSAASLPVVDTSFLAEESESSVQAYCVKCRAIREIKNPTQTVLKNSRPAVRGTCPTCSTAMFKIGFKALPRIRNSMLLENMQGFLRASGWGEFEIRSEIRGKFGTVTILDPPTFEREISYGNQFLEGIAAGLLESMSRSRNGMELLGEKYEPGSRVLSLYFAEQGQPIQHPRTSEPSQIKVTDPKIKKSKQRLRQRREEKVETPREVEPVQVSSAETQSSSENQGNVAEEQKMEVEDIIQSLNEIAEQAKKAVPDPMEQASDGTQPILVEEKIAQPTGTS